MYVLNKIVGYLISPAGFVLMLVAAALAARILGRKRLAVWAVLLALANFWIWSTPWMSKRMGAALEAEYLVDGRVPPIESLPQAEVIVLHGGSMGCDEKVAPLPTDSRQLTTNGMPKAHAEMWASADRVWHAARLWKAGKAPKILVTSKDTDLSTGPLLADLGVPKGAVVYDFSPRNTEEETKAAAVHCSTSTLSSASARPKALVVTSAWHMKRTMLMYRKYAPDIEAIPAPCDFENTFGGVRINGWAMFLPDPAALLGNSIAFHERLGYFGYRWFR